MASWFAHPFRGRAYQGARKKQLRRRDSGAVRGGTKGDNPTSFGLPGKRELGPKDYRETGPMVLVGNTPEL